MKHNKRIISKAISLTLAVGISAGMGMTAFASVDVSPNTAPSKPKTTTATTNSSVVARYNIAINKTYKIPDTLKKTGDVYNSDNTAVLTVNKTTGNFTGISNGTANIILTNGSTTRKITVTVGTAKAPTTTTQTSTGNSSSALAGYPVSVLNKTTPAVKVSGFKHNGVYAVYFTATDGTVLGSISEDTQQSIVQPRVDNGSLGTNDTLTWIIDQFNIYRGLSGSVATGNNTNTKTTGNNASNVDTTAYAQEVINLINNEREQAGLHPLEIDYSLMDLADTRAKELTLEFSHTRPDGTVEKRECATMGQKTPKEAVKSWMGSAPHKRAIINENGKFNYNYIGAGCYQDENGKLHWIITFSK